MGNENKKQQDQKPVQQKKKGRVYPEEDSFAPKVDDTSMSAGNLTNNPRGRIRTRDLHIKKSVMGSDDDGQAD